MPESEHAELLRVVRPMLKGHIRQTRNLLAVLTQLEQEIEGLVFTKELRELDHRMAQGGRSENGNENRVAVG